MAEFALRGMILRFLNLLNVIALSAFILGCITLALGVHHWRILQHVRETRMEQFEEDWSQKDFFYASVCVAVVLGCRVVYKVRRARESAMRREAFRRQICTNCGYDLRATPERCPECGAVYKRYL